MSKSNGGTSRPAGRPTVPSGCRPYGSHDPLGLGGMGDGGTTVTPGGTTIAPVDATLIPVNTTVATGDATLDPVNPTVAITAPVDTTVAPVKMTDRELQLEIQLEQEKILHTQLQLEQEKITQQAITSVAATEANFAKNMGTDHTALVSFHNNIVEALVSRHNNFVEALSCHNNFVDTAGKISDIRAAATKSTIKAIMGCHNNFVDTDGKIGGNRTEVAKSTMKAITELGLSHRKDWEGQRPHLGLGNEAQSEPVLKPYDPELERLKLQLALEEHKTRQLTLAKELEEEKTRQLAIIESMI